MAKKRVVVITGAAGGIGAKLVDRFLQNGDSVIAVDNRPDALEALFRARASNADLSGDLAGDTCGDLAVETCDVSVESDVRAFFAKIGESAGRVDVLVNCAGIYPIVPFEEMTFSDWQQVIAVNLNSMYLMSHSVIAWMKTAGRGRIINVSSASIFEGVPGQTHYVAAKAGVVGFTRSLAMELGGYGITVNAVAPGLTITERVKSTMEAPMIESQRALRCIQRDEWPQDLAGPVFFLASSDADFVSGQLLVVDGGKIKH